MFRSLAQMLQLPDEKVTTFRVEPDFKLSVGRQVDGDARLHEPLPFKSSRASQDAGFGGEAEHAAVVMAEALILRLAAYKADIDLLDDDGELEGSEHLVPKDRGDIKACARSVALDRFGTGGETVAPSRHRSDLAPFRVVVGLDPIIQHVAEIGQRVALGAHVPIEH